MGISRYKQSQVLHIYTISRDEVVVGAPTYSDPQRGLFEVGQIHIYFYDGVCYCICIF